MLTVKHSKVLRNLRQISLTLSLRLCFILAEFKTDIRADNLSQIKLNSVEMVHNLSLLHINEYPNIQITSRDIKLQLV